MRRLTIHSMLPGILWLALAGCLLAQAGTAGAKGGSPAVELTVPLGQSVSGFTFSKTGSLTYRGKPFSPAVAVRANSVSAFKIDFRKDNRFAGAISEDGDGQNSAFLLDLSSLVSTPLQQAGKWSAAQKLFWSPSGRYMLALCSYEGQRFISVDLQTKKVVEGDFLGRKETLWGIVDEPRWTERPEALAFTVNETCNAYDGANCDPERVIARYSVSLDPATLKATSRKMQ
jgi:hypothetical protein